VIGLAPRALRDCAPSALSAVGARPLNFTVRRLVSLAQLSYFALGVAAALILTLMYSTLAPKGRLAVYLALALIVPLLALWLYIINAYHHSNWWPFGHGSFVPHALAALVFFAVMGTALVKVSGSLIAKAVVALLACTLWGTIWFNGTLLVACVMGDCV
jgi:hypothetical protein